MKGTGFCKTKTIVSLMSKSDLRPSFMGSNLKNTQKELRKWFFEMDDNEMLYLCKAHQKPNSFYRC